jgi:signal transduction histidine kinase
MAAENFADERRLLEGLSRDLGRASHPSVFQNLAASRFHELFTASGAIFFAPDPSGGAFLATAASGPGGMLDPGPQFDARGPFVKWLRVNEEPLVIADQPGVLSYLRPEERATLESLSASVCVPLVAGRLLSFIVLSDVAKGGRPAPAVVRLIATCARHAAVLSETVTRNHLERERLEAASRAQQIAVAGQLASAVAHEVRNPLATIRSSVQYVLESPTEWSNKSDLLRRVITEVDRINQKLSGVLGLTRKQELALTDLDVRDLLDASLALFEAYFHHHQLTLERDHCDAEELPVLGDPTQLRQVLLNVILNACQATPDGGRIRVISNIGRHEEQPAHVCVEISDTGCGMSPQQLARLFEPFYTTKPNGTGLGLAICHDIMKAHHGEIGFESEPGVGTTVRLTLPMREA